MVRRECELGNRAELRVAWSILFLTLIVPICLFIDLSRGSILSFALFLIEVLSRLFTSIFTCQS